MARLISCASGNFTSASTWKVVDNTTYLDSEANSTATTAAYVASQSNIPGAITVDGLAVNILSRSASPTGTFSFQLWNATASSSVAEAVVDVADVPNQGWILYPFSPVVLTAGHSYQVRVKSSTAGQVTVYRDATAGNWSRMLRTTTNQAPAAGDQLNIMGEHTGPGTGNNFVITMDNTTSDIFGDLTVPHGISINKRSTMNYGYAASTAYKLVVKGVMRIHDGGTFTIGTVSNPIPQTSSADLEFSVTTNVDSGLYIDNGGTFIAQGYDRGVTQALLDADASAGATTLTSDISTGWKSGDIIAIASTNRVVTEGEQRTLSVDASGTTLTIGSGLTYSHLGSDPIMKAELINVTRNVKIHGTSVTLCGYLYFGNTSIIDIDFAEFYYLGSATALKRGVQVETTTGSANLNNCGFHDFFATAASAACIFSSVATLSNLDITNCSFSMNNYIAIYLSTANTNRNGIINITNCYVVGFASGTTNGIYCTTAEAVVSGCRVSGAGQGFVFPSAGKLGNNSNNVAHSCGTGLVLTSVFDGSFNNFTTWKNTGYGINATSCTRIILDTVNTFGNTSGGATFSANKDCQFKNFTSNGLSGFTQAYGIYIAGANYNTVMSNSSLGSTFANGTADLVPTATVSELTFQNCIFSSPTEVVPSAILFGSEYKSQNHDGVTGNHKRVSHEGTSVIDTIIYNISPNSLRMSPSITISKLRSPIISTTILSGKSATITVYVRKSVVGDGTAYNGNQPRLVLKSNPAAGISNDTVLATASGPAGSWEVLTGVTPVVSENTKLEFFVDCDGTQGWINLDTVNVTLDSTTNVNIWANGEPVILGNNPATSESISTWIVG